MDASRVTAFVLAGGEGRRLRPLTNDRPKPALSVGPCRIIDFVLSNLRNSGIRSAFVLLQYKPQVLLAHLARHWGRSDAGMRVEPVVGEDFEGTADAVRRSLHLLRGPADAVAVFAADHVYRMDVGQMLAFNREHGADASVAALPVPIAQASDFGVICVDAGQRITGFEEKPARPTSMPDDPQRAFVSMGNYLFRPEVLRRALHEASERGENDFGHHVLPRLVRARRLFAYDFRRNVVPGLKPYEQPAYWRDVGTLQAYTAAYDDVLGARPALDPNNAQWPIGMPTSRACNAAPDPIEACG